MFTYHLNDFHQIQLKNVGCFEEIVDNFSMTYPFYHYFFKSEYTCGKKKVKVSAHTYKQIINSKKSALKNNNGNISQ